MHDCRITAGLPIFVALRAMDKMNIFPSIAVDAFMDFDGVEPDVVVFRIGLFSIFGYRTNR